MRISDWSSDVCSSDLSQIDKLAPIRPASTPSTVYTTDIPRTYAPANAKPRQRDTLARAPASPATLARRIGTMGSTHGVNDNNSPKTRHDRIILAQPAVARNAAMPVSPMLNTAPTPASLRADPLPDPKPDAPGDDASSLDQKSVATGKRVERRVKSRV